MKKVIIILGATAVGKSEVAMNCASKFNGEIISADSMQIYKELNIGTAKVKPDEMQKIPHHLINIKHFYETYNVFEFVNDCKELLEKILSNKKVPIIVGGTNLYIKALIENYSFDNVQRNEDLRQKLNNIAENSGLNVLYEILKKHNQEKAEKINSNDKHRILRALESLIIESADNEILHNLQINIDESKLKNTEKLSDYLDENILQNQHKYDYKLYALNLPREELYDLINKRVDIMIKNGLLDEVKSLKEKGLNLEMQAGKSIGYKELLEFLDGKISYDLAVEKIKQHSRNYAKRQYTWLNNMKNITWIDAHDKEKAVEIIINNFNNN